MKSRTFATGLALKTGLEQRLKSAHPDAAGLRYARQKVVFHRMLARLAAGFGNTLTVKGGVVLTLRLPNARQTRDLDLGLPADPGGVLDGLRRAGRLELGDFMTFDVEAGPKHPTMMIEGLPSGVLRYRAQAQLAGKIYGDRFGIDVVIGEASIIAPESLTAEDLLAFAGVAPPTINVNPVESHVSDKIHAYTLPRPRQNSRVKDLPDLGLLAMVRPLDSVRLHTTISQSFAVRGTHPVPTAFPDPPASWSGDYEHIARDNRLPWGSLAEAAAAVRAFLDPMLAGGTGTWDPKSWSWSGTAPRRR